MGSAPAYATQLMESILSYRKIDAHAHLGRWKPERLLEAADRVGVQWLAVSGVRGSTPDEISAGNDVTLKAMRDHPGRFFGQCRVNPRFPDEALAEIDRCIGEGMVQLGELYDAVKINDPLYYPIVERCIDLKLPIMMHARADLGLLRPAYPTPAKPTTSVAADFADLGRRYPEAMIVHAHIGGGGDWEYMCKTLRDVPNVYLDTAGSVTDDGMIDYAVATLGVERLMFASDMNFESAVGKIMAADLTDEQRRMIFWDNYNGLLRAGGRHVD